MSPQSDKDSESFARDAFAEIRRRFPHLEAIEDRSRPVEISFCFPVQDGLRHKVRLSLQNNDELHFEVGQFWLEWFPCSDSSRVRNYVTSVADFLVGKSRVLEHYRGARCIKAELQIPEATGWKTIGETKHLWLPIPLRVTYREVRNTYE